MALLLMALRCTGSLGSDIQGFIDYLADSGNRCEYRRLRNSMGIPLAYYPAHLVCVHHVILYIHSHLCYTTSPMPTSSRVLSHSL